MQNILIEYFLTHTPNHGVIYDIGAGDLRWSKILAEARPQQEIIATDLKPHADLPIIQNISLQQRDVTTQQYNDGTAGILYKNVLQFIPKEAAVTLLQNAWQKLVSGGVIAIETFWQPPEPMFKKPLQSTWTINDFQFLNGVVLFQDQITQTSPGLDGETRTFYLTRMVIQK